MQQNKFEFSAYLNGRKKSFGHALRGIAQLIKQEPNARIHLVATITVIIAGFMRGLGPGQWIAITLAIGIVWIAEALNTAVEILCNLWCDNQPHPAVKIIKDVSAGAVLISALVSVVVALIVFIT